MISIEVDGEDYDVPSSAADANWAADQVAFEQAVADAVNSALDASENAVRRLSINVTPVGNAADTTEDNLMTYSLPAGTLSANGMGVRITAFGTGVSTADVTTVRCYFGSTLIVSKVLTASQINIWRAQFEVFRTAATTQVGSGCITNGCNSTQDMVTAADTPAATLSGAVTIKLTGQRASTSSANSVSQYYMLVELIP